MIIEGWGRYPTAEAEVVYGASVEEVRRAVCTSPVLARGLGRSYGDSSLASRVIDMTVLDRLRSFDPETGLLTCESGLTLAEILRVFVPQGWFLPVTPGTQFVTVGGAIASDVHGKNHHTDGSFSDHVTRLGIVVGDGSLVDAARTEHAELFHATCGGMGLTGVIVDATIQLKAIRSRNVDETVIKAPDLAAALDALEQHAMASYSVAWIDCLATGRSLGRSLVMLGDHAEDGDLGRRAADRSIAVPFNLPGGVLNRHTVSMFNGLYYGRIRSNVTTRRVPYEPFFYPLDALRNWNRLYGRRGFLQYQLAIPLEAGREALRAVLVEIARTGLGSPLAVLKVFGPGNANHLSFPIAGYTLALDLQTNATAFDLTERLDALVLAAGGRLYLTKDSRMSPATFWASYPRLEEFQDVRQRYGARDVFVSSQSTRLGLS